jgi:hypothetical protein
MAHIGFKSVIAAAVLAGGMAAGAIRAAQEDVKVNHTSLKAGDMAPDFTLLDNHWKQIPQRLSRQEKRRAGILRFGLYRRLNEGTSGLSV